MTLSTLVELFLCAILLSLGRAGSPGSFDLRNMSSGDFDAVTSTIVSAFDPGPMWTYIYQFRDRFSHYHWRCRREEIERQYQLLEATDHNMVIVPSSERGTSSAQSCAWWAEMTKAASEAREDRRTVLSLLALGLGIPGDLVIDQVEHALEQSALPRQEMVDDTQVVLQAERKGPVDDIELPCSLHLDMNLIRALHLVRQIEAAEKKYIEDAYQHQLYLGMLATHPNWDGHGFGAAHLRWGMELAKALEQRLLLAEGRHVKIPVTLMATPAGYPLYKSLGFESVSNVTFKLLDNFNGGTTWFEYMRWFSDGDIPKTGDID